MAEQVNKRIEDTINELEQMRRTGLYDDEEIRSALISFLVCTIYLHQIPVLKYS